MHRLTAIIGPAPSEFSLEDFEHRLRGERARVSSEISLMKLTPIGKRRTKKSTKAKPLASQALKFLEEKGLDLDNLEALLGGEEK